MKTLVFAGVAILVIVAVAYLLLSRRWHRTSQETAKTKTLEDKLSVLEDCGLKLAQPFTTKDLLADYSPEDYEKEGFEFALASLAGTEDREPYRPYCVNLWHFDAECIYDDGDYRRIAERMVEMAQGSLPLDNIKDHVDMERGEVWLSFSFKGEEIKIQCEAQGDWVDEAIFGRLVSLLNQSDPSKVFIEYYAGGQDCIIGCVTREELERLKKNGIEFAPLK
jgi:hypothetical protein